MAQPNRRNLYRDNGAAAYDVYAWNDQTARQYDDNRAYERTLPIELPDERAYEQPYRRVKARTAIAPFTLAGMLTVACLMILVIFGYVQLFEASSNVSALESRLANLKEQQLMLQSKYDAKIDLTFYKASEDFNVLRGLKAYCRRTMGSEFSKKSFNRFLEERLCSEEELDDSVFDLKYTKAYGWMFENLEERTPM